MLHIDDVITEVNGVVVTTVAALQAAVQAQMKHVDIYPSHQPGATIRNHYR